MLNLLFISDNPKVAYIKSMLQPVVKVIVDVVTDFDHGLKDVFEKRPGTVCIQDQIGGVTGESVARHIQMLLGKSAPTFILLHSGNGTARAVKGLYEHLIDLSQADDIVAENIKNTLESLLGDQWVKIYIPPKSVHAPVRIPVAVPDESRDDADKLVDDFLSDLEMSVFPGVDDHFPAIVTDGKVTDELSKVPQAGSHLHPEKVHGTVESDRAQSINDSLAEILLMEGVSGKAIFPGPVSEKKDIITIPKPVTPPLAAEFRIGKNTPQTEDHIPEDMLLAFEENYRSESLVFRRSVVIALVCAVCAGGGWYFVTQKPQLVRSLKQRYMPSSSGAKLLPVTAPIVAPIKTSAPLSVPQAVMIPLIPAFIPKEGHDGSYALKHPGWERYVGTLYEFRVFSASGHIRAVQVLAVKDVPITESLVKSILRDFVGGTDYRITSRISKAGVRVDNGTIQGKGEVKIYRKNGAMKAFVLSMN